MRLPWLEKAVAVANEANELIRHQCRRINKALRATATALREGAGLRFRLNTFSDQVLAESQSQRDDGPDNRIARAGFDLAHKGSIDLQHVNRQQLQKCKRGIPGAEVIDGDAHAVPADLLEGARQLSGLLGEDGFGDLELEQVALDPGHRELSRQILEK